MFYYVFYIGDGKSHYIKKELRKLDHTLIIAVNEAFSVLNTISKLRMLPLDQYCGIYFNFTVVPPPEVSLSLYSSTYLNYNK